MFEPYAFELRYKDEFIEFPLFRQRSTLGQAKRLYRFALDSRDEVLSPPAIRRLYELIRETEQRLGKIGTR